MLRFKLVARQMKQNQITWELGQPQMADRPQHGIPPGWRGRPGNFGATGLMGPVMDESLKMQFQRLVAQRSTSPKSQEIAANKLSNIIAGLDGVDFRDLLPEIVQYIFSLGGWAEDQKNLGFWSPQQRGSNRGVALRRLLGAHGPLVQQLIRGSKDPNLVVWPRWTENDMPARVYRLYRNPRLAPFQEGTSRFLAMWQNPTVFQYYMICFTQALLTRWGDDSANRPDTAVYFEVAQEYFELFFRDPLDQLSTHEQFLAQQLWQIIIEVWLDAEQHLVGTGLSRGQLTAVYRFVTHIHLYSPYEQPTAQYTQPTFSYAKLIFDLQGPMYQFLEKALDVKEEQRLWTAQRVWLAWIRPWRYRAKYYDFLIGRKNKPGYADADILSRITPNGPPEDAFTPEYGAFVRDNLDCYSTLLHVWTERVAQVQYPVYIDVVTGAKAQERLNERDVKKAVLMALDAVLRVYAEDRGILAWSVEQTAVWLADEGFGAVARRIRDEYDADEGYAIGEAVDGEKLVEICPRATDSSGRPELTAESRRRFTLLGLTKEADQNKLVGKVNRLRRQELQPNPLLDELTALFTETAHGSSLNSSWVGVAGAQIGGNGGGGGGGGGGGAARHWPLFEEKNPGVDRTKVMLKYHSNIEGNLGRTYRNVLECLRQLEEPQRTRRPQPWGVYVFWGVLSGSLFGFLLAVAFGLVALAISATVFGLIGLLLWECQTSGSRLDDGLSSVFGRNWAGGPETAEVKQRRDMAEFQKHFLKVKRWCEMMVPDINARSTVSFVRQPANNAGHGGEWEPQAPPSILPHDVGYSVRDYDGARLARLIQLHRPWSQPIRSYESELLVGVAYKASAALDAVFERRPWYFPVTHAARVEIAEPQRPPWTQLTQIEQDAAAALVEAHLRLTKKTQKKRNPWQYLGAQALRKRSGIAAIKVDEVWDGQDFAFNDFTWQELETGRQMQAVEHHLPEFDGLSWTQLRLQERLALFGWFEASWDHSAQVAAYLKTQAGHFKKPSGSATWSQHGETDQGFHSAVVGASHRKPTRVDAAFALVEKRAEYTENGVQCVDALYELRILDNLQGTRIVTAVLADHVGEKCTIDNETWFADPYELVRYHQHVPYCIDNNEDGKQTMYFLKLSDPIPEEAVDQGRYMLQTTFFPSNLRFLGSAIFYTQCMMLYLFAWAVYTFLERKIGLDVDGDGDTDGSMLTGANRGDASESAVAWQLVPFAITLSIFAAVLYNHSSALLGPRAAA